MTNNDTIKATDKSVIIAVDDTPENLDVLKGVLINKYSVKGAINGPMALKIAEKQQPDLILLDIMMPEMDGYEVCRQLKQNPKTAAIPVIFITAKTTVEDEQKGFSCRYTSFRFDPGKCSRDTCQWRILYCRT